MTDQTGGIGGLWDDDAFRARVSRLASERGRTISDVCRSAGLSASYLAKPAGRAGRSVEALLGIARTLEVSLVELVGTTNRHDATPTDDNLVRLALVAEIAANLYIALGARKQVPAATDTVEIVSDLLRRIEDRSQG